MKEGGFFGKFKQYIKNWTVSTEELFTEALYLGFDGNYEEAIDVFDEAIYASEGSYESKEGKSLLYAFKALALSKLESDQKALGVIDKSIEYDEKSSFNWSVKGDIHHNLDQQEESLKAYERALENAEEGDEPEIIWNRADVLNHLGRHEEALKEYEKSIELDPELAANWYGKSDELLELGKVKESLEACEKALELDPDDVDVIILHGNLMLDMNRNEDALKSFEKAASLDSTDELAWYNKACALSRLNRKEEALDALTVATSLAPTNLQSMRDEKDFDSIKKTERFSRLMSLKV